MTKYRQLLTFVRNIALALLIATAQVLTAAGPFIRQQAALAVTNDCVTDTAGPNDEPGQKDLNSLCVDDTAGTSVDVEWNWDETGTSGNNSMDACSLFDTDGDGYVNYSVCVVTNNDPATHTSTALYSCGDDKPDRCTSPVVPLTITGDTECSVLSPSADDPFPGPPNSAKGDDYPNDTKANCTLDLSDVGGVASAELIDVCSYPSQQPNSDPSDCVIIKDTTAFITLIKQVEPASDLGLFNLLINGQTHAANVGDNGTTGIVNVDASGGAGTTFTVSETAGTNTSLTNYTSTVQCTVEDKNGTPTAGPTLNNTSTTVTLKPAEEAVCTFTNTRQSGTITLIKNVINDNGGTAGVNDFGLSIGNTSVTSGQTLTLTPGSYTINEAGLTGYSFVSISGTGCPAQLNGSVQLDNNENITCTITNNDIAPQLTVIKHVVNDNGGTKVAGDFTMNVTGTNVSDPSFPGAENPGTTVTLNAGSYSVDEDAVAGYAKSLSADCSGSIAIGQTKTCTITNNDIAPQLTLVKQVVNDNGGTAQPTAWTLSAAPSDNQYPTISGAGGASDDARADVTYTLSETGPNGYNASSWNCDGGLLNTNLLQLDVGDNVTCIITNNDIAPRLTVVKVVTNDDGGQLTATDFPLYVDAIQVTSGVQNEFNAGTYTVSETQQNGYTFVDFSGDCLQNGSITLEVGGVYTCTLTNDDQPARITVTKVVVNDNGGTAQVSDFALYVDTTQVNSGVENTFNANESYTVSELALVDGYTQTSIVCIDTATQANVGATFTPANGQSISCTITNDDVAPTLTLVKQVVNDNGGTATTANFQGHIDGNNVAWATPATLNAGAHTASETVLAGGEGYTASSWTGDCAANGTITLTSGQNAICYITNDDQAATLILVKNVVNDDGGTLADTDFPVFIDSDASSWGQHSVNAGAHTVSETTQAGYEASDWSGDCDANGNVTLGPGQTKTCTITNDNIAPTLTLKKVVVNDDGGDDTADEWTLTAQADGQTALINQTGTPNGDGTEATTAAVAATAAVGYDLSEAGPDGYTASSWDCDGGNLTGSTVTLGLDEDVTCTITNNDEASELVLVKNVINDNGGNATQDDFTPTVNGTNSTWGTHVVDADSYNVSEVTPTNGYNMNGISCYVTGSPATGVSQPVVVDSGESVTCEVTNDDIAPRLTLVKHVTNDNGGDAVPSDWTLTATPTAGDTISGNGDNGVVNEEAVSNLTYTLSEAGPSGYSVSVDWTCDGGVFDANANTIVLNEGEDVTCEITNDDQAPKLTLVKVVVDEHGDDAEPSDWTLTATPSAGATITGNGQDGVVNENAEANTQYTLSESGPSGYTASTWDCDGQGDFNFSGSQLTMSEGADVTCIITNTSQAPSLTVIKTVVNDDGGDAVSSDFTMHVSGNEVSDNEFPGAATPGTTVTLDEGAYSVSEDEVDGYAVSYSEGCNGTASVGEADLCIVTNDDIAPTLTVRKNVDMNADGDVDDNGDIQGATDWTWDANGTGNYQTGSTQTLAAGTHTISEDQKVGYEFVSVVCYESGRVLEDISFLLSILANEIPVTQAESFSLELAVGDEVVCTYENKQLPVLLNLAKTNNRPDPTAVGDVVTYTLEVSLPENSGVSYNTSVSDLPPEGFEYVNGSATASQGSLTEVYSSPGVWAIGTMLPGQTVTLTYQTLITDDVSAGTYPDLAFAQGCGVDEAECPEDESVLSNLSHSDTPFVGTEVTIEAPAVLGETVLVETGSPLMLPYTMAALSLLLLGAIVARRRDTTKGGAK